MVSSQLMSNTVSSWSFSQDLEDSQLPDDESFVESLLGDEKITELEHIDQDVVIALPNADATGAASVSPTSVPELISIASPPKRRKTVEAESLGVLPFPRRRTSWDRPVCAFLNYLGTRSTESKADGKPEQTTLAPAIPLTVSDQLNASFGPLSPTPTILFPVCPCKLRLVCYTRGEDAVAPPILELLAGTSVCHTVSPDPECETRPAEFDVPRG